VDPSVWGFGTQGVCFRYTVKAATRRRLRQLQCKPRCRVGAWGRRAPAAVEGPGGSPGPGRSRAGILGPARAQVCRRLLRRGFGSSRQGRISREGTGEAADARRLDGPRPSDAATQRRSVAAAAAAATSPITARRRRRLLLQVTTQCNLLTPNNTCGGRLRGPAVQGGTGGGGRGQARRAASPARRATNACPAGLRAFGWRAAACSSQGGWRRGALMPPPCRSTVLGGRKCSRRRRAGGRAAAAATAASPENGRLGGRRRRRGGAGGSRLTRPARRARPRHLTRTAAAGGSRCTRAPGDVKAAPRRRASNGRQGSPPPTSGRYSFGVSKLH
jgi:hypothetical protein